MLQSPFNIVFIPVWLENAMARTGMNFSDALDKEKLFSIVSKSDVVFYLLANDYFNQSFLQNGLNKFSGSMFDSNLVYLTTDSDLFTKYMTEKQINEEGQKYSKDHLFFKYAYGETVDIENIKDKPFIFQAALIDDKNIVVTLRFTEREVEPYRYIGNLYEQLLRIVNYYAPFHEIARTPIFLQYCKYLGFGVKQ